MHWWIGGLLALAGCGRLSFEPLGEVSDDTTDPSVRYPMDDDPTTGLISCTVPALAGSCGAACPTPAIGRLDGGYAFEDGQNLLLPAGVMVSGMPFTVAVWIRPRTTAQDMSMVSKAYSSGSGANSMNLLVTSADGRVRFETTMDTTGSEYLDSRVGIDVRDGLWHHIAASWDLASKRLYVDGALVSSAASALIDSAQNLTVGADLDFGGSVFGYAGELDDLRIYARALDPSEVAALASP